MDDPIFRPASMEPDHTADDSAYREGYNRVVREIAWARDRGWAPTERQIVVALMQAVKVYGAVRGGRFIAGRRPEWLRGRADGLRTLLEQGFRTTGADQ